MTDSSKPEVTTPEEPKIVPIGPDNSVSLTIKDNVTALPDTSITITCPTTGVPKPRVTWRKNGEALTLDENTFVDKNGNLVVSNALDSAEYSCHIENEAGRDEATSTVMVVGTSAAFSVVWCVSLVWGSSFSDSA